MNLEIQQANFRNNLAKMRKERGWSLQTVANYIGGSKVNIWEIEKGRNLNPSLSTAILIADMFSVSLNFMLTGKE